MAWNHIFEGGKKRAFSRNFRNLPAAIVNQDLYSVPNSNSHLQCIPRSTHKCVLLEYGSLVQTRSRTAIGAKRKWINRAIYVIDQLWNKWVSNSGKEINYLFWRVVGHSQHHQFYNICIVHVSTIWDCYPCQPKPTSHWHTPNVLFLGSNKIKFPCLLQLLRQGWIVGVGFGIPLRRLISFGCCQLSNVSQAYHPKFVNSQVKQ